MKSKMVDTIKLKKHGAEGLLTIQIYEDIEDGVWYAEAPSLDIIDSGSTQAEAEKMIIESIGIAIEYMSKKGTIYDELKKLGWVTENISKRQYSSTNVALSAIPANAITKREMVYA